MALEKVAAVLGIGPGLGAAVAHRFAREGYSLALLARSADKLAAVESELMDAGGIARSYITDASDPESVAGAFARIREELGEPEVLVYNAGAFKMAGILELDPADFENLWKANCMGAFLAVREVLPAMQHKKSGTILLTGATASLRGSARFAGLAVGKFGLRALAQSLAREFGPQGIHVSHVIVDGMINTPTVRAWQPDRDPNTLLAPDAIAETYWQLHSQDPSAWTLELDVRPAVESF